MDTTMVLLDRVGNYFDAVHFARLAIKGGSVYHSGDSVAGRSDAKDSESVSVRFADVPLRILAMGLVVTNFGSTFQAIQRVCMRVTCRILLPRAEQYGGNLDNVVELGCMEVECGGDHSAVLLCKLFRDEAQQWTLLTQAQPGEARNVEDVQLLCRRNMADIIPSIRRSRDALTSGMGDVASLMALVDTQSLDGMQHHFARRGGQLSLLEFVTVMCCSLGGRVVCGSQEELLLTCLLVELYQQMDANGDGCIQWEEFMSYLLTRGMLCAGLALPDSDPLTEVRFQRAGTYTDSRASVNPMGVLKFFPCQEQMVYVEEESCTAVLCSPHLIPLGRVLHTHAHGGSSSSSSSSSSSKKMVHVLDVEFCDAFDLALSATDLSISLWTLIEVDEVPRSQLTAHAT
jgi:stress response protein SCP2